MEEAPKVPWKLGRVHDILFPENNPPTDAFTILISDAHIGNVLGLMPEKVVTDNGQTISQSFVQEWVYSCWTDFWKVAADYKKKFKKRAIVVMGGDMIHGTKLGKHPEVISDQALQLDMARTLLTPVRDFADKMYAVKGTEFHSGLGGSFERILFDELRVDAYDWRLRLDICGKLFDIAHKGRAGTRPWTVGQPNQLSTLLIDYAVRVAAGRETRMPDYMIRGHAHCPDDTGDKFGGIRGMIVPSWMLTDSYAHNKGFSDSLYPVGGVLIDGSWVQKVFYMPEREAIIRV